MSNCCLDWKTLDFMTPRVLDFSVSLYVFWLQSVWKTLNIINAMSVECFVSRSKQAGGAQLVGL